MNETRTEANPRRQAQPGEGKVRRVNNLASQISADENGGSRRLVAEHGAARAMNSRRTLERES